MTMVDDLHYIDCHRDDPCDDVTHWIWPVFVKPIMDEMRDDLIDATKYLFSSGGAFPIVSEGSRRFMAWDTGTEMIIPHGHPNSIDIHHISHPAIIIEPKERK